MKTLFSTAKPHFAIRIGMLLLAVTLVAAMVGCAPVQYDLTIASSKGGAVNSPGEGTSDYEEGAVVNLVATPDAGYRFVNWTGDVDTMADVEAASTTITMNGDYEIIANFEEVYELTVSSTEGGSVTTPGEGIFTYEAGAVVSLVASPVDGYRFVNWTGDVDTIADVNAVATTVVMNGDYCVAAAFEEIPVFKLTISSIEGGSVTAPGEGTFAYEEGTVVGLVATPDPGHLFVSWTGDVGAVVDANAAVTTISMNDDYALTASFKQDEVVVFVDPNLESVIRQAIGVPERTIYARDMERLTKLQASQKDISDLTGLEHAISLTELHLYNNQLSDVSQLANLTCLARLDLLYNQISDISPLAGLTGLTELDLGDNQISDISALTNLTQLTRLGLERNRIGTIPSLATLSSLAQLCLWGNQISDISPLADLQSLRWLDLGVNSVSDILPLANLTGLTTLGLVANQLSDISPLANLTGLTELRLGGNRIGSISPLANLTGLTFLQISGNDVGDISPLANLTSLTGLELSDHTISDVSLLVDLTQLTHLSLVRCEISDISPLANLTSLTSLDLQYNLIGDISPLASLTGLTELDLGHNEISDLSALASLTGPTRLRIRSNQISDISSLADLRSLTGLDLGHNQISDISPLASLTGLTSLHLGNNQIADITALSGLTQLRTLYLGNNQISDLTSVSGLVNLGGREWSFLFYAEGIQMHLDLSSNRITDISSLVLNEGLSAGDGIDLRGNPLNFSSRNTYIPELVARGARVFYD